MSEAWERTPIHVAATAWFDGRSKRARVDVHSEMLEWHEGAAPYYETCYTVAFDGTTRVFVDRAFGYNEEMFPRKWAQISREAPPLLRDGGWIGDFTGIDASAHFFSRSRPHDLKKLVLAANSPPSDPNGATTEAYRIQRSGTDEEVQINVTGVKGGRRYLHRRIGGILFSVFLVPPRASRQPFRYNVAKDASSMQVQVFWRKLAAEASRKKAGNAFLLQVTGDR